MTGLDRLLYALASLSVEIKRLFLHHVHQLTLSRVVCKEYQEGSKCVCAVFIIHKKYMKNCSGRIQKYLNSVIKMEPHKNGVMCNLLLIQLEDASQHMYLPHVYVILVSY